MKNRPWRGGSDAMYKLVEIQTRTYLQNTSEKVEWFRFRVFQELYQSLSDKNLKKISNTRRLMIRCINVTGKLSALRIRSLQKSEGLVPLQKVSNVCLYVSTEKCNSDKSIWKNFVELANIVGIKKKYFHRELSKTLSTSKNIGWKFGWYRKILDERLL